MSREEVKKQIEEEDNYHYHEELFYTGEGDLLDTAEGRAKFCRLNETTVSEKKIPVLGTTTSGCSTTRESA